MKRLEGEDDAAPRDPQTKIWNKKGLPHRGWTDGGVWDAREDPSRDPEEIIKCEMCGQAPIRFVYLITHPKYEGILQVGSRCAEKMVFPSLK